MSKKKNLSPAALAKRREYTRQWKKKNKKRRSARQLIAHRELEAKYRAKDKAAKYLYVALYFSRTVDCRLDFCDPLDILISMEEAA